MIEHLDAANFNTVRIECDGAFLTITIVDLGIDEADATTVARLPVDKLGRLGLLSPSARAVVVEALQTALERARGDVENWSSRLAQRHTFGWTPKYADWRDEAQVQVGRIEGAMREFGGVVPREGDRGAMAQARLALAAAQIERELGVRFRTFGIEVEVDGKVRG